MKLLKPSWVNHDDKPIFSVDVHQECLKFATGGQGMDSGRVVIWNLLPVLSEKAEQNDAVPKMLCQMDNHLACVNSVRWSQAGQMLASGSDDKLVMIWKKTKGSSSGVFSTGGIQKNPESWKCDATLRGHSGDVLDLAWSPQDRWLASCSIDNTIIVWDVHQFPLMVAKLKGHTGLVKGVTWDPVGKFLASQSDDRSVKIWKTADWSCSSTITEPFEECGGTTHILRLSWSPDGQYLVSAHAMNGGGPTAQIIEREGWKCDKDFVGHRKAVTCVRFHNSILKRQAPKTQKSQQYCVLAVGSRDRSLSVWMTALQRPLVVIHELFNDSILDLSWGPEKCILMACSGDGTVACLQFSESELGTPLSEEDKNSLYQRIYGKSATLVNGSDGTADMLIENPELLLTPEKVLPPALPTIQVNFAATENHLPQTLPTNDFAQFSTSASSSMNFEIAASTAAATPTKAINKQLETRTADGKRRITPVFIPLNQDVGESMPQLSSSSRPICNTSTSGGTTTTTDACAIIVSEVPSTPPAPPIRPIITEAEQNRLDSRLSKPNSTAAGGVALVQPHQTNNGVVKIFPSIVTGKSPATVSPNLTQAAPYQASTTGPKLNINTSSKCEFQKTALNMRVHVHNGNVQTASGLIAKVTTYALRVGVAGERLWEVFVGSPIVNFNFTRKCVMLCSLDGSMRLLDMQTGSAMLPVITLNTVAVQCAFCPLGKLVGVITDCGLLRIWNVAEERVSLATTCAEIFGKFGAVLQFVITERGVPLVLFANGNSYTYSAQMQSWLVLNTKDPIMRHGLQTTISKDFQKNYHLFPVTSVQASTNSFAAGSGVMDLNTSDWQLAAKVTFIENQIKLCEAVNSPNEELKHWHSMLAYQLAVGGTEKRLRMLLDDLLGSTGGSYSSKRKTETVKVLEIPKLWLFENALNVLKSHVKWQRIYIEYHELFEIYRNQNSASTADKSSAPSQAMDI